MSYNKILDVLNKDTYLSVESIKNLNPCVCGFTRLKRARRKLGDFSYRKPFTFGWVLENMVMSDILWLIHEYLKDLREDQALEDFARALYDNCAGADNGLANLFSQGHDLDLRNLWDTFSPEEADVLGRSRYTGFTLKASTVSYIMEYFGISNRSVDYAMLHRLDIGVEE